MELWIRSQDKLMLLKVDAFTISEDSNNKRGFGILDGYTVIGWYKSEERALQVLDEIQHFRNHLNILELKPRAYYSENNYDTVYEMPKE